MQPLLVLTWNTLAPVYFRGQGGAVEADFPGAFGVRHAAICEALVESAADIICLQEHWFAPGLAEVYEELLLAKGFQCEALRRTARNCEGRTEDGVAVLVRRGALELLGRHDVKFHDHGIPQDRVALLLTLRDLRGGSGGLGGGAAAAAAPQHRELAVLCTHLTYPHSGYDVEARGAQIRACLAAAERWLTPGTPLVLAGDLNGPSTDGVGSHLRGAGFRNAWEELHRRPCRVTHVDHRGGNFASDHVWLRGPLAAVRATLLPEGEPDDQPMRRPAIGGAARLPGAREGAGLRRRRLEALSLEDWCELSDHRPLLVALAWEAPGATSAV